MMGLIHCFTVFFIYLAVQDVNCKTRHRSKYDGKIVGGYDTTIQSIPYQVYLLLQKGDLFYQCGGSILNDMNILTAAHCLTGMERVYVRAGSTYSDQGGSFVTSRRFSQHPLYNNKTSDFDVGVIRLSKKLALDGRTMKAIRLVRSGMRLPTGSNVTVSGWGATSENGDTSETLMAVKIPIVSNSECAKSYGNSLTSRMFCAGVPQGGKDSCQGDSGGPVVLQSGQQAGVVSFGIGCARQGTPGVYTNLADRQIRTWIKIQTGA
ncbi:trypsin alpha-3-like [Leptidea sinapis]|uniref:trypsin alpha-3-like n=1 Tax=Leptidea sinapis TaxID=189913 RepID=UPI0021327AEB|nr:trypsin alpha-3-like [Leptidea sinapis]